MSFSPMNSPNYPAPPWTYTGARVLNFACRASNPAALEAWIPEGLRHRGEPGEFAVWFAHVPNIPEIGPDYFSNECGIVIPVSTDDGVEGSTFAILLVDNDVALAGGREIWGYPKKLAQVDIRIGEDGLAEAQSRHFAYRDGAGQPVIRAQARFGEAPAADPRPFVNSLEPRLLRRVIPSPYGNQPQSSELLMVAHGGATLYEERTGTGEVVIEPSAEGFDSFGPINCTGALLRVVDFVLPYARPLGATSDVE
jgi:acetoacetate decarboxylase